MKERLKKTEVKKSRKKLDMTIGQFAQFLNVSTRTVQRWEKEGAEVGQSAGVNQLLSLYKLIQNEQVLKEFLELKESLMGANSNFESFGSVGLKALSSALPIFGMLASGAIGNMVAPEVIQALQKFADNKNKA